MGNLYNWHTGFLQEYTGITASHEKRIKSLNGNLSLLGGCTTDAFLTFIEKTETPFSVVLNIFSITPEDNRAWLTSIKKAGLEVKYIELGNENYLNAYKTIFPDASSYIKIAKQHWAAGRDIFPNAKYSLVTTTIAYHFDAVESEEEGQAGMNNAVKEELQWNEIISREIWHDALTVHMYTYVNAKLGPSPEEAYGNVLSSSDALFDKTMAYYKKKFPGKELWVTEWNMSGFSSRGNMGGESPLGTFGNVIFIADFQMKLLLSAFADCGALHQIPDFLDMPGNEKKERVFADHERFTLKPEFYVLKLLRDPVCKTRRLAPITVAGVNKFPVQTKGDKGEKTGGGMIEISPVTGGYFYEGKEKYLVLINRSAAAHTIGSFVPAVNTPPYLHISLSSDFLSARKMGEGKGAVNYNKKEISSFADIQLAPHSINVIVFNG